MTDYEKLSKEIDESGNFWKAPEGKTVVVPISELSEPKEETINGQKSTRVELKIKVGDQEKVWSLATGGKNSAYAKVVEIGKKHKTLVGIPIEVSRQGKDKENTKYIIFDASK